MAYFKRKEIDLNKKKRKPEIFFFTELAYFSLLFLPFIFLFAEAKSYIFWQSQTSFYFGWLYLLFSCISLYVNTLIIKQRRKYREVFNDPDFFVKNRHYGVQNKVHFWCDKHLLKGIACVYVRMYVCHTFLHICKLHTCDVIMYLLSHHSALRSCLLPKMRSRHFLTPWQNS